MRASLGTCALLSALCACATEKGSKNPAVYWEPGVGPVFDDSTVLPPATEVTSSGARRAAAAELECEDEAGVTVRDYGSHIRAFGCQRLVYFLKRSATNWERAGPVFDLDPQDLLPVGVDLSSATRSKRLGGKIPDLEPEQIRSLRAWEAEATLHCILRPDGTLRHCIVIAEEKALGDAINKVLPTWRYSPATVDGRPIPSAITVTYRYEYPRPECNQLSSSMERLRCKRLVDEIDQGKRR